MLSKCSKIKTVSLPERLSREVLAYFNKEGGRYKWQKPNVLAILSNAPDNVLNSNEMAIALSDYVFKDKNIIIEIDEFFINK